ncbi:MAG: DUF1778 domain-containing protein [[Pasteurella] mairii]|uniref:Uncharacterized protein conserved in bacteria n=1 Tax=[Pasteurella] mairii TaxID=757 RepID=A0A379B451_9PAST|nr:DUF1778 domain-containing protein [[Pasteurella] mairii]SUB33059.1 Uncharacterized protein conserved in bacteria [[Pasteurella] mairii]
MTVQIPKARLEAKVNLDIYQLIKQAAAISGRTLTDFVVDVAYKEAKKTISEHQVLRLTLEDQALLIESLSKPFKPNASMQNALDVYEEFLSIHREK